MRRTVLALMVLWLALLPGPSSALFGSAEKAKIGTDAPRFSAPLLEGGEFDIGPLIGKKAILLDFWSIYCVSCVQEMPKLVDIYGKYSDQFVVVGVDLDSFGTKRVAQFVKGLTFKVPYPIVIDKTRQVAAKYGVTILPTTIIIDKQGKIVFYHVGYTPGDETVIEDRVRKAVLVK